MQNIINNIYIYTQYVYIKNTLYLKTGFVHFLHITNTISNLILVLNFIFFLIFLVIVIDFKCFIS